MKNKRQTAASKQPRVLDIQGSPDTREIPIQKVGIRDLRVPVRVGDGHGGTQATVARANMYVDLAATQKGTHMSRFLELVAGGDPKSERLDRGGFHLDPSRFRKLLHEMVDRLDAQAGYIEVDFPYFINKEAPVTGARSVLDYEVGLVGSIEAGVSSVSLKVVVPVTSLCPCSKAISRYGAHNQRSHVTVQVETEGFLWIEELITLVEAEASCELYALLKREDEQFITEKAYENPKFVEDLVRDVAARLDQDDRVTVYSVGCENFESIHNHSAYALIEKDKAKTKIPSESAPL
jgi:GTP cyclohydrolase I